MNVTQPEFHGKAWGREDWIVNCPEYCCKLLTLNAGMRCSYHRHQTKKETFYVLQGIVRLELENEYRTLLPSDTVTIEPKQWHRFWSIQGALILEVSTHHSEDDVERKEPSGCIQPTN
jgi:quercetin dioxygenase-like cupin family protein